MVYKKIKSGACCVKKKFFNKDPQVAVLAMEGIIGNAGRFQKTGINAATYLPLIKKAFNVPRLQAVALVINSPGGSPVQSDLITREIRYLAQSKQVPVLAFIEDVGASGGYWLACAADEIYALDASIIGSIGVIAAGFGFQELIEKHGIERRVYTVGKSKSLLDPFQAEKPADVKKLKEAQADVYDVFVSWVKERRGEKLDSKQEDKLFSGTIFSGRKGLEMGLIDGLTDVRSHCREAYGSEVTFVQIKPSKGVLSKFGILSAQNWVESIADAISSRVQWMRYGL